MLWPSMGENLSLPAILFHTPTQVNANGLFGEVHGAEEGLEAGIVA
jgi:hypothetical protein